MVLAVATHSRVHRSSSSRVDPLAEAVAVTSSISTGAHNDCLDCQQCGGLSERERVEEFARSVPFDSHMYLLVPCLRTLYYYPPNIYTYRFVPFIRLFETIKSAISAFRPSLNLPSSYAVPTMSSS